MPDFADTHRPALEAALLPGETLAGIVAANEQKTFSGTPYAVGVTADRLLLLPFDWRGRSKGDVRPIAGDDLASAKLDGAGGDWWSAEASILDATAAKVELKLRDGTKLKLMLMHGGDGILGKLGGGPAQRDGLIALVDWMQRHLER